MKHLILLSATAAILIATSACARTVHVTDPLPIPARPTLPKIKDAELACLPDAVYGNLARRDNAWRQHAEKLETIIRSTH